MQIWPELASPPQAAALAARSTLASIRTGELDEVGLVDQRRRGLRHPLHAIEDVGGSDLVAPGIDHLGETERGQFGGLDDHGGARLQSGDRIAEREDQREVPWADDSHHRERPVLDAELLRAQQRRVGAELVVGKHPLCPGAVEVDQVGQVDGLAGGVGAHLAGLRLHRVGDPLVVVDQPVAQLAEPAVAALAAESFPLRLVAAHPRHHVPHPRRRVDLDASDHLSGRRVADREVRGGRHGVITLGGVRRRRRTDLHSLLLRLAAQPDSTCA